MGDLLEFTTSSNDVNNCYLITSDALKFYVKGEGDAVIRLMSKPNEICKDRIIISNCHEWLDKEMCLHETYRILEHTYKPFWISWYGKEIKIGIEDNPKPFLVKEKLIDAINYISFSSQNHHTMYWKVRLPPKIKEPIFKKINDGQLKWVKMDNNCLPEDAVIGGYENEILYIMRAMHKKALTPGKFVPSKGAGYVAWGGDAHEKYKMEVLCGYDCKWMETKNDEIPNGAVEGGFSELLSQTFYVGRATFVGDLIPGRVQPSHKILCGYDGVWVPTKGDRIPPRALIGGYTEYHETMFVGRTLHNNNVIPGKIAPSHKVCYIPYNGKEIAKAEFEILVNPNFSNEE